MSTRRRWFHSEYTSGFSARSLELSSMSAGDAAPAWTCGGWGWGGWGAGGGGGWGVGLRGTAGPAVHPLSVELHNPHPYPSAARTALNATSTSDRYVSSFLRVAAAASAVGGAADFFRPCMSATRRWAQPRALPRGKRNRRWWQRSAVGGNGRGNEWLGAPGVGGSRVRMRMLGGGGTCRMRGTPAAPSQSSRLTQPHTPRPHPRPSPQRRHPFRIYSVFPAERAAWWRPVRRGRP